MGNLCSWCFKNQDESQTNGNLNGNYSGLNNSERSLTSSVNDERTPLVKFQFLQLIYLFCYFK